MQSRLKSKIFLKFKFLKNLPEHSQQRTDVQIADPVAELIADVSFTVKKRNFLCRSFHVGNCGVGCGQGFSHSPSEKKCDVGAPLECEHAVTLGTCSTMRAGGGAGVTRYKSSTAGGWLLRMHLNST